MDSKACTSGGNYFIGGAAKFLFVKRIANRHYPDENKNQLYLQKRDRDRIKYTKSKDVGVFVSLENI